MLRRFWSQIKVFREDFTKRCHWNRMLSQEIQISSGFFNCLQCQLFLLGLLFTLVLLFFVSTKKAPATSRNPYSSSGFRYQRLSSEIYNFLSKCLAQLWSFQSECILSSRDHRLAHEILSFLFNLKKAQHFSGIPILLHHHLS